MAAVVAVGAADSVEVLGVVSACTVVVPQVTIPTRTKVVTLDVHHQLGVKDKVLGVGCLWRVMVFSSVAFSM